MIICHSKKFIYIHINKCGGTSLTQALSPFLADEDIVLGGYPEAEKRSEEYLAKYGIYKHSTAAEIKQFVGSDVWDSYYKFATIRDPWERVVSTYYWFHKTGWNGYGKGDKVRAMPFDKYALSSLMDEKTCTEFLFHDNKLSIDKFYDVKDINLLMEDLKNRFGFEDLLIERKNASVHEHYSNYYKSSAVRARVGEYFSDDVENFNFTSPKVADSVENPGIYLAYKYQLFELIRSSLDSRDFNGQLKRWIKTLIDASYKFNDVEYLKLLEELPALGATYHTYSGIVRGAKYFCSSNINDEKLLQDVYTQVISLKRSKRRLKFFENWNIKISFQFYNAIDSFSPHFNPSNFKEYREHFKDVPTSSDLGHLACSLSHFQVWRRFLNETTKPYLLILEDDAVTFDYSQKALNWVLQQIPEDADLVMLNGRSAEKLYSSVTKNPPYKGFPEPKLYSREDVVEIMSGNYDNLRPYGSKGRAHWNGTDGYLLTRKGAEKLVEFIDKYGLPPFGPKGGDTNVDMLLGLLTLGKKDYKGKPAGFNSNNADKLNLFHKNSLLKAYVSPFPVVDEMDRMGIEVGSDIEGSYNGERHITDGDAVFLKELALQFEKTDLQIAAKLMALALKGRPNGPVIKRKLKEYRARLEDKSL
ncbi:glycosyltransferase family 25 protein [Sessilibacter corallicola]|uniref:Glycosyl transferase family 25 domain-containing protein n=1 Tax=Sessilibacter corallicola TaxID=2904075 RepID=A0ABQ0A839_9GAMM